MKRILRITLLLMIFAGFIYTLYYLYRKNQAPDIVYETETAFTGNVSKKTVATGSVVPRKEILIKPIVSGIIDKLYIEAGNEIQKGDLLARIKIIPDMVSLNNAENRVQRAKIALQNAEIDYNRNKLLFDDKVISKAEFQPFELQINNARLELEAAEDNLQIIREGVSKSSKTSSNTLVRSTISGMVLDVPVKEGTQVIEANTFNEGTSIAIIADMGEMIFDGKLDESEVGKVQEGMELLLTIGALQDQTLRAKLNYISPKGVDDNGAIQFQIKADINKEDLDNIFIRAGYSANASIVLDKRDSVLLVKESLVEYHGDSAFVYVEKAPQKFEKIPVVLGLSDGILSEIISGITSEDKLRGRAIEPEAPEEQ